MAFKTLDQLRTVLLNPELGLTSDGDNVWGTTADRNRYIQTAIAKLWPNVAKLARENVTITANVQDYTLTTLYDVERIDITDPALSTLRSDRIKSWNVWVDESAGDPPVIRLLIPAGLSAGLTIVCTGYAPYVIPSAGGSSCDIPPRLEWLVTAGARVECYRSMANKYANFERFQNENRQNALGASDVLELLRQAQREFGQAMTDNARNFTGAHRARSQLT